ncbi:MAG: hypothetical protein IJH20_05700 [Bacilli bacterium]|nr:hypothetical protein [Bacilli bacterium]
MKKFKILLFLLLLIIPFSIKAETKVDLYLFYGDGCPHCAEEESFLNEYLKDKDDIELHKYEVWHDKDNQEILRKVQDAINNHASGVPYMVIGNKPIVGYYDGVTNIQIEEQIEKTRKSSKFVDKVKKVLNNEKIDDGNDDNNGNDENVEEDDTEIVPFFGKIKVKEVSLPLLSIVLGFIDGFNPCATWILIFLITMLINMKNRKRMWILGFTFILTSGIMYLLFMLAILSTANYLSGYFFIRLIVAAFSIGIGIFNIYNFIKSLKKDDGCNVVNKKNRKKIMQKIMNITTEKKFIISLIGIIVLAITVNLIEAMCSLSIPVVYVNILSMNNLSIPAYSLYLFLYILFFLIDDIVIFTIAMITFKVTGISTKFTKYSHLIAGIITLIIGILLIFAPGVLMSK